jgi:hypothetical protein
MTLVAIALQGCDGMGRGGVLSAIGDRACRWTPDPQRCEDAAKPELGLPVGEVLGCRAELEVSVKVGLWGGVIHREERETKSLVGSGSSVGSRESQESDAGVRGLGLQGFGLWPLRNGS